MQDQTNEPQGNVMVIAVASEGDSGLDSAVAGHFGRCPFYALVEVEGSQVKQTRSVANPFYEHHGQPGEVPRFIKDQGADVMLTGGMGPRAVQFFAELNVEAVTGAAGTVGQAVQTYLDGTLTGTKPCEN